jgi:hypothetical protein
MNTQYLPDEMIVNIFTNLSQGELLQKSALVCQKWNDVSGDDMLWNNHCKSLYKRRTLAKNIADVLSNYDSKHIYMKLSQKITLQIHNLQYHNDLNVDEPCDCISITLYNIESNIDFYLYICYKLLTPPQNTELYILKDNINSYIKLNSKNVLILDKNIRIFYLKLNNMCYINNQLKEQLENIKLNNTL